VTWPKLIVSQLDKFCFFQSPSMTPALEEPRYSRPSFIPLSGTSSPSGFPFHSNGNADASNSPRNTPTPTRHYSHAQDAFNWGAPASNSQTTPRASMNGLQGNVNDGGHQQPGGHNIPGNQERGYAHANAEGPSTSLSDPLGSFAAGYQPTPADARAWSTQLNDVNASRAGSPSLAAK
jgi:hypothetical protein